MNNRCTFKQGLFNCGSYAFNLYKENIDQGDYCDQHYWEDQAKKAAAHEREAIAQMFEDAPALVQFAQNDQGGCLVCGFTPKLVIEAIRARGTT